MLKHIYKALGLVAIFVLALWFFSRNIEEVNVHIVNDTVESESETLPIISLKSQGIVMNRLFGYTSRIAANEIRESVTPLDSGKSLEINIGENKTKINKLSYEVRSVDSNELLDSGQISAFNRVDNQVTAELNFDINFAASTEYSLKIILVSDISKKINYYTRLKYYADDSYLDDKIDFVMNFHKMTIEKNEKVATYIEPLAESDNSSLALVNINSNYDNIVWGSLKPVIITDVVPTVREFNIETAAIQLVYYAQAETSTGIETFYVKEYYRVKRTDDRMYLLWFERTMEAELDVNLASVNRSQLKLGITKAEDMQIISNDAATKVAISRNGDIYLYDLATNVLNKIYSQYIDLSAYEHELYRQQENRIISIDAEGNITFAVYGYIAHGAYEGKVAMVLYKYHVSENVLEEILYIPFETSYQILKENFEKYCYINGKDVFYFSIDNAIYSYNIVSDKLECIVSDIDEEHFTVIPENTSYVWEVSGENGLANELVILNLETEERFSVSVQEGRYIKLIGVMGTNVVYGLGKQSDIRTTADGTNIYAMNKLEIVDKAGELIKTYKKKKYYVTNAYVKDNVIYLERMKKQDNGTFVKAANDNIINRISDNTAKVELITRVTDKALTEWYISFPSTFVMENIPEYKITNNYLVTEEHSLYLEEETDLLKYYVYAKGEIKDSFTSAAKAIVLADSEQGVVIDSRNQTVWERGGRFNSNTVSGITNVKAGGNVRSVDACAYMLLKSMYISVDMDDIAGKNMSILEILKQHIDTPVNLSGCTLDEVLYFVSGGKPVIAMKDSHNAVLITGYTINTVTIYDPSTGITSSMYHNNANAMFEAAGNVFVSYMKGE